MSNVHRHPLQLVLFLTLGCVVPEDDTSLDGEPGPVEVSAEEKAGTLLRSALDSAPPHDSVEAHDDAGAPCRQGLQAGAFVEPDPTTRAPGVVDPTYRVPVDPQVEFAQAVFSTEAALLPSRFEDDAAFEAARAALAESLLPPR